jgi:hypothetical protein
MPGYVVLNSLAGQAPPFNDCDWGFKAVANVLPGEVAGLVGEVWSRG